MPKIKVAVLHCKDGMGVPFDREQWEENKDKVYALIDKLTANGIDLKRGNSLDVYDDEDEDFVSYEIIDIGYDNRNNELRRTYWVDDTRDILFDIYGRLKRFSNRIYGGTDA